MTTFAAQTALLQPQTLTIVAKQVVASADAILNFMGFQPGGANERYFGHGRTGEYHVYDDSRKAGKGRAPGTAAARSKKQNMKQIPFTYPRMHDSISLLAEYFHNLGQISDPAQRDEAGKMMISMQTATLMQKAANWRVALTVGMLKDSLYITPDGEDWLLSYNSTGNEFQINFQVPAGNKTTLQMTDRAGVAIADENGSTTTPYLSVPWSSPGANIPLQFARINQARNVQGVGPVTDVHITSIVWQYLVKNDYLSQQAGISNSPFQYYDREVGKRPDNTPLYEYIGRFAALPGIDFHISDEGVELWDPVTSAEIFTKHWSNTQAVMMSNPKSRPDGFTLYQGSEPIAEYDGGPKSVKVGLASWSKATSNPTADEVYILDNCLPVNHDPFSVIVATVA